jgi:RimJ/RimL family protein N-acetyltransferase
MGLLSSQEVTGKMIGWLTPSFEWGSELPRLSGPRIDLRWLTQQDAPAIFSIFGDSEVMRYWSSPPLRDVAGASELIESIHRHFGSRNLFQWGICRKETDEIVGTCTLLNVTLAHRRAEVGIALGRAAWGHGFATEALEVLIGFVFGTLDLHRLEADVDPENERSLRLFERQGFRREGYLRERWHHLGELHDTIFLGLLRRESSKAGAVLDEPD